MKIFSICLALLMVGAYTADATETPHSPPDTVDYPILFPQTDYDGWVNPEDLAPMPQCIAQQDQSAWLSAMTKCTSKQCTWHLGFICTHHQWLANLACLSVEFSSGVVAKYLPYCARSILAKGQLYQWTHEITGRTWLVEVGDAMELESLSPASLSKGYADVDVISHAPTCLANSVSALSMEPFQHVMASCGFTGTAQHTGRNSRPWEYSESLQSMIAMGFETVGYDLTHRRIKDGEYFDKHCFCSTFTIDFQKEPCSGPGELDLTRERLWVNATCGSRSLPGNWTEPLKTTQFAYIPIDDWRWPKCVSDMPEEVIELTDQCATDACDVDSSGYCKVKRAIDRSCFCRSVNYSSCGGSCQIFETRIDYVKWLDGMCGSLQDWHGLPDNWRQLAAPTPVDMIPWGWALKSTLASTINNTTHPGYPGETESCPSTEWKLGSFALVNIASVLGVLLSHRIRAHQPRRDFRSNSQSWYRLSKGISIAALQLLANYINALIVQNTPGYEEVPVIHLMLLWCSIPRPAWIAILIIGLQSLGSIDPSASVSVLVAEVVLQVISFYHMSMTVNYGRKHNFYLGAIGDVERGGPAKAMYAGSLMWLMIFILILVQSMRTKRKMEKATAYATIIPPERQTASLSVEPLMAAWDGHSANSAEGMAQSSKDRDTFSEKTPLTRIKGDNTAYSTFSRAERQHWVSPNPRVKLCLVTAIGMFLHWVAQWLFWGGFVGLSLDEFCPPRLGALTAIWITFSLAGAAIVFI